MKDQASLELGAESVAAAAETAQAEPVSWKDFVQLAKPGIIFSNLITAFGGFWVASKWNIDWALMIYTLIGTALVMGGGCVLNNYLDRDLDIKMARTQNRPTASGKISAQTVLWYGITLSIAGVALLWFGANSIAAMLGLIGLFLYVWVYTAWFKRTSVWNTFVGSFSGAMPPVIGYCAVHPNPDTGALLLFLIMFLWQPPHFWALAIRRMEDYRNAGYPMLPVVKGTYQTKISMIRYVVLLVPVSMLLSVYGYAGQIYFYASAVMGLYWAYLCIKGFKAEDEELWAKKTFIYSINYLTLLFIIMVINTPHIG
ncbi:heme o synthase [Paenibacillus filicis]|uniref:Protoheme IX farnesyltransferase n=1 Tax=Paenibacillus gyeongsangnamensis TaxID=3388067 RepID=A0ABT4QL22_9BACL|nr:heme o synthase [Paenibacillus filicis]MCZ8517507.1 heme o synthase [Paenibacillus filicis]